MLAELAFLVGGAGPLAAEPPVSLPDGAVMIGGGTAHCRGVTTVRKGARANPGQATVRAAPSVHAPALRSVPQGAPVVLCETASDGFWTAVVYRADISGVDPTRIESACFFLYPVQTRQAYRGPCLAGWVQTRALVPLPLAGAAR